MDLESRGRKGRRRQGKWVPITLVLHNQICTLPVCPSNCIPATSRSHCFHAFTLMLLCQDHLLRSAMPELLGDTSHSPGSTLLPPLTLWAPKPPALAVPYECVSLVHEATKPLRAGLRSQSHLLEAHTPEQCWLSTRRYACFPTETIKCRYIIITPLNRAT